MTNLSLDFLEKRLAELAGHDGPKSIDKPPSPPDPPDMDDPWRNKVDGRLDKVEERLGRLENEVHAIKGAMDWMKVAFTVLCAVTLGGFAFIGNLVVSSARDNGAGISSLRNDMLAEARANRTELTATVGAIANAITATRQQAPQVILVPAPQEQPKAP